MRYMIPVIFAVVDTGARRTYEKNGLFEESLMKSGVPFHLLLAEDNTNDVAMFRVCLERARILNDFSVVSDGKMALEYVRGEGAFEDRSKYPRPGLIFLDLNLPKKTGIEVLKALKDDPSTEDIPVVILTISQEEDDILQSYQFGSHVYIHKPVDQVNLREVILGLPGVGLLLASGGPDSYD
jgi:CheY-like chemotaxis protein